MTGLNLLHSSDNSHRSRALAVAFALFIISLTVSLHVKAASFTVTRTDDRNNSSCSTGDCSLREALNSANGNGQADTITFSPIFNVVQTISLNTNLLIDNVTDTNLITITGPGANLLTIRGTGGNNPTRVFYVFGKATISGVTVAGGNGTLPNSTGGFNGFGGGIALTNSGAVLTLTNVIVSGNSASSSGGGIFSQDGTLVLNNTSVTGNTVVKNNTNTNSVTAGGIRVTGGTATLNNSTVSGNTVSTNNVAGAQGTGGGISVDFNATLNVNSTSVVSNNTANMTGVGFGGGIMGQNDNSVINLNGATISGNRPNPATITSGSGGGLYLQNATTTITNSTISGNSAIGIMFSGNGGGLQNDDSNLTVSNSTISGNTAGNIGGGISQATSAGNTSLTNVTLSNNGAPAGGGIFKFGGVFSLRNTITAGNTITVQGGFDPDISNNSNNSGGPYTSNGNNLIGNKMFQNNFTNDVNGDKVGTNAAPIDAKLDPLGNYGGANMTHRLRTGSPAIEAGNNCVFIGVCGTPLPTDQRGSARVGNVEIGAFEVNASFVAVLPGGRATQSYNQTIVPNSGILSYSVTSGQLPPGLSLTTSFSAFSGTSVKDNGDAILSPSAVVAITGTPILAGTYNFTITATDGVTSNATQYQIVITAGPTAASATVGGQVLTADGRGIRNVRVSITDPQGQTRTSLTGSMGYYSFTDIPAGATYVISVSSKNYTFDPPSQVHSIVDDISDINFVSEN